MLKPSLIPTSLIQQSERKLLPPVEASPPGWPSVWASLFILVRFVGLLVFLRLRRASLQQKAQRIREFIEASGGIWIKVCQLMSARRDVLPEEYCREFERLWDRARAFPLEQARRILQEDLGHPPEQLFSEFEETPLAAASIGQTYRARLRGQNVRVAVKIQRPNITYLLKRDLALVGFISRWMSRLGLAPRMRWMEMYEELENMLGEECDYRLEAEAGTRMRKILRSHGVYAPKIFFKYCSRRVLVMEFVQGVQLSDYLTMSATNPSRAQAWLSENDISLRKVARRLYLTSLRQINEEALFHADLHPGNIMLLRGGRLAMIDFGAVGSLESGFRDQLMLYKRLNNEGHYDKANLLLIQMSGPVPPHVDLNEVITKLTRAFQQSLTLSNARAIPYDERMFSEVAGKHAKLLGEYGIPVRWDFLRVHRTRVALEGLIRHLDPDINYERVIGRYLRKYDARLKEQFGQPQAVAEQLYQLVMQGRAIGMRFLDAQAHGSWRGLVPSQPGASTASPRALLVGGIVLLGFLARGLFLGAPSSGPQEGMAASFFSGLQVLPSATGFLEGLLIGVFCAMAFFRSGRSG